MGVLEKEISFNVGDRYAELSKKYKTYVLLLLSHEITIRARGAYPTQENKNGDMEKLIALNELQHNISGQLRNMMTHKKRYPDTVFIYILFEAAENGGCRRDLDLAFDYAFEHLKNLSDKM